MAIQNTQTPVVSVATEAALSALIAPAAAPLQVGSLAFIVADNSYWAYKPGSLAAAGTYHIAAAAGGFWEFIGIEGDRDAKYRGYVEMPYGQPQFCGVGNILTTATASTHRFIAKNGGAVANVVMQTTTASATSTAATSITVTGAAAGTAGVIVLTFSSTSGWVTGDIAVVGGVLGTTEANGTWQLTVIDGTTLSLNGSTFVNTWSAGGTQTAKRSVNTVAIYNAAGVWCGAAPDQVSAWEGTAGTQTMALVNTANPGLLTLNPGAVYYMLLVCKGTTPPIFMGFEAVSIATANLGLTAAKIIWGAHGSTLTKLPGSITPSNIVTTNAEPNWFALS